MDVGGWLRGLGLGQYETNFRDNKINADLLPRLTNDDLKDIGISALGDRLQFLAAVAALAGAKPTADVPASRSEPRPPRSLAVLAERRPITVMFCDLVGSTSLAAKLDAEDWRNLVTAYLDEASAAVTDLGSYVPKKFGDGLMALFGYPQAQENDAERAVRAALAIQRALADLNAKNTRSGAPELSARIGIECGSVVVDAAGEVFGEAPNVAARVQAAAEPGSVLVTERVQRQVAGLFVVEEKGAHELKGVAQPQSLYRVIRASGAGRRGGGKALTQFVGRKEELGLLASRWERARGGEGQLALIVGEPGLGKSRLIDEFHTRLAETPHTWVEWSASQLLQNTPLHPIVEWGRQRFSQDAPAEQRLVDLEDTLRLIGLDPAEQAPLLAPLVDITLPPCRAVHFPPEELRRRQLAAMAAWVLAGARSQPVVLAFEDLHWADPTSLDLLRLLADRGAQAGLLLLATTRPEFHAPWSPRPHHSVITLSPLDRAGVARMVGEISTRSALSNELIERVNERTGGVPLFVEEVTRLLIERGEQGGVQAVPPTLQQSLAARLDRLGAAREVAQIAAVLGRDFAYALLRRVAEIDESALQASLNRLTNADLLFVEGARPEAKYRFKHALIQDAAYESLLKSRRQALHRRAAEALLEANAEPEAIAHHFTEARLDDLAVEWWGKAGDQALRRSAFQEAIAHLGKAIDMADKVAAAPMPHAAGHLADTNQRLKLRSDYASAVMLSRGYAAEETRAAFARAVELTGGAENAAERFTTYWAQWVRSFVRGDLRLARSTAETFLREAEEGGYATEAGVARRGLGVTCLYQGDLAEARTVLERTLAEYAPDRDAPTQLRFGLDTGVVTTAHLALAMWHLGEVERARRLATEAVQIAAELDHPPTNATTYLCVMFLEVRRDAVAAALRLSETVDALGREHRMDFFVALSGILGGWARGRLYEPEAGAEELRKAWADYVNQGNNLRAPWFHGLLAELEAVTKGPDAALALIDRGLAIANDTGEHFLDPYLHRLRGDILLKRDSADPAPAEEAYRTAIDIAKQQGSRSYALLASLSLANFYQSTARATEAHVVLAPALEGFSPTPEMPEIAEAQALLAALAEMDEVRQQAAQQQRLTQLRVAYGNALIATRGYGAAETTEAFARVRESAFGDKDAPERLAAHYGLWAGSLVCGELSAMRERSTAFLSDVATNPDSPEAGIAHRTAGITHWFAGEYAGARNHLERALALFQPGRDDDLAFRFGNDAGVAAMHYLALTLWPMGDVGRAVSLVGGAEARVTDLAHIGTRAYGKSHTIRFNLMRGDLSRAALEAVELARLTREHALPIWRGAYGIFFDGLASAQRDTASGGLEGMRRGIELLREQNVLIFDGLLKIALAEAEARADDVDHALATLNEALTTCHRTGHRSFEAELHRVLGKTLLKRDPHNTAPAQEAFQSAIAIARHQGARSFELRAAVSLAKLQESAGRPVDAHAVLASALEGFSPTSEMSEIAEAQALLAELSQIDEVKAEAAHWQRLTQLRVAYGNALFSARGFGAPETTEAFARARESAPGDRNAPGRLAANYGFWVGSFTRGELASMQAHAGAFLDDVEARPNSPEAGVAHRAAGVTCWFAGQYREARDHLEQALVLFQAGRDDDLAFRFGVDLGTAAMVYLAFASWPLGEVDRATSLIDSMQKRITDLTHVGTLAFATGYAAFFHLMCGDRGRAAPKAVELIRLVRMQELPMFRAFGVFFEGWAASASGKIGCGLDDMRLGVEQLRQQNVLLFDGLLKIALAEAEATAGDLDRALAVLDEGLATAERMGYRAFEAELHRARGEILLKQNPTNRAPAEEAFLTAIAVAKQQGTRSFELRAALALAKLYQSTMRPVEAHSVLASAFDDFSRTGEMPEIAEAQAMLVALA
jgi:class 3 adenylate cyclase/predicted ATPase